MMRLFGSFAAVVILAGSASAAPPPKPKRALDPDKIICKRWADTGSLVARTKACHTRRDWDRIADSQQQGARKVQEGMTTRPNCNLGC
jgi:hypothetical protein